MSRREAITASLSAWRDAERRLAVADGGSREALADEVVTDRTEFQRLSAEHMAEWIAKLQEAEGRRASETPSTFLFHEAARDTEAIAAEIWETARASDEDTPQTAANQRRSAGSP